MKRVNSRKSRTASAARRYRAALLPLAAVMCVALAGCAAGQNAITPGPAPTIRSSTQIDPPLLAYLPTVDELVLIDRGDAELQVQCAARYGVTIDPRLLDMNALLDMYSQDRRYGIVNRDEVEQYGYGSPPSQYHSLERGEDPEQPFEVEVLSGTTEDGSPSQLQDKDGNTLPEGGCGLIGSKESSGGHKRSEWEIAYVLLGEAWDRLLADPGFQAAEADWATCMSKSGYDFQHRWDAANSLTGDDPERSKDMALLDLDCAEETNYIGRAMAIDVAIQNQLISDNEASLRAALDIQKERLSIAKKALK